MYECMNIWGLYRRSVHTGKKARQNGIHPGFETQGRCHQKSKTGVSVAPQKGLFVSSKNFKKKKICSHKFASEIFFRNRI